MVDMNPDAKHERDQFPRKGIWGDRQNEEYL